MIVFQKTVAWAAVFFCAYCKPEIKKGLFIIEALN